MKERRCFVAWSRIVPQHRVAGFERVDHSPLGDWPGDAKRHLAVDAGKPAEVRWPDDPGHGSV
jgi:hypothetical protein